MANHKSAEACRQTETRMINRYQHKTTRNVVRALRATTDKKEAQKLLPEVTSMLDKLAKRNIIHRNKAANLKSSAKLHVNGLKEAVRSTTGQVLWGPVLLGTPRIALGNWNE